MESIKISNNIFEKLLTANIIKDPFPHIVIENFLDKKTLRKVKQLFTNPNIISEHNYHKLIYHLIRSPIYKDTTDLDIIVHLLTSNIFSNAL